MGTIAKIAPNRQEGQREDLYRLEERMHFLLSQIAECDRIIRQAREAERKIADLRAELAEIAGQYNSFLNGREEA